MLWVAGHGDWKPVIDTINVIQTIVGLKLPVDVKELQKLAQIKSFALSRIEISSCAEPFLQATRQPSNGCKRAWRA